MMNILRRVLKRPPSKTATVSARLDAEAAQADQDVGADTPLPLHRALNKYVIVVIVSCLYDTLMAAVLGTVRQVADIPRPRSTKISIRLRSCPDTTIWPLWSSA